MTKSDTMVLVHGLELERPALMDDKKSALLTDYHEFPVRSPWTCGEPGWQEVADIALDQALEHAAPAPPPV